jgi:putative ATP-dependent endonuclease of the OLD family
MAAVMYLSLVDIKNFRCFEAMVVALQPGLNVLVGRNNTGKTNILQAIRMALGPGASRGDALWLDRDDFYRPISSDTTERTISINLTFSGLNETQRAYFYEIVDFDLSDLSKSKATIRFEASWPKGKRQATIKRTGGPLTAESPEVPTRILASLPVTFLPALRDAEAYLAPGYRSRLASLLGDIATRRGGTTEEEILKIYLTANEELEKHPLIDETKSSLQATTRTIAGSDYSASTIKASEVEFEKVLRSLQMLMSDCPIGALSANGLGYNNLLYIAVVLEHLRNPDADESPLLLVEEPEAHLHPQLTTLLADYLANHTPGAFTPQTIVTTHSPTLAAHVPPSRVNVLYSEPTKQLLRCNGFANAGMTMREQVALQRMMDVTRATAYFSRALIIAEGISEAILIPVLAKRLGYDFAKLHISVIPICGVAFGTLKKILGPSVLGIPVAIVTDADPPVQRGTSWKEDIPEKDGSEFKVSDRTAKLTAIFDGHATVRVMPSKVTLEYDLAEAGRPNARVMAAAWKQCFDGSPKTFNKSILAEADETEAARALATWRGICRANHSGSKAEFSHHLAELLTSKRRSGQWAFNFEIPKYLRDAITYAVSSLDQSAKGDQ